MLIFYSSTWLRIYHIQRIQSAGSIHAINILTSGLFTANVMWTHWNILTKMWLLIMYQSDVVKHETGSFDQLHWHLHHNQFILIYKYIRGMGTLERIGLVVQTLVHFNYKLLYAWHKRHLIDWYPKPNIIPAKSHRSLTILCSCFLLS